jgi:exonuclease SbcD
MTRLLATGDLHIGAGAGYADDRLADQEDVLEQIVDVARERDVDGVLLAGDIFDRPKPTPAELHLFGRFARRLEQAAIPAVAVLGNAGHDQLGADQPSALELFSFGEWMRVSRHPEVLQLGGVAVCTLPSTPVSRLVAARGGRDDVNELAVALLLDTCADIRAQVKSTPAVLLGHWAVSGASLPNGLPVSDLHEPVLPLDALETLDFDAMVFGHIHKAQMLEASVAGFTTAFYVGSPMTLNFGEANVEHGAYVLEWQPGPDVFSAELVPLLSRRFVTVDVDLLLEVARTPDAIDETDVIGAAIAEQLPLTDAVLRIRYRATEEQARRVDVAALKGFCMDAGAHRVYQVTPEIVRAQRARVAGVDESLAPQAALDVWIRENLATEDGGEITGDKLRVLLRDYSEAPQAVAA